MSLDKTLLKEISILYVEDDDVMRTELASLLTNFFAQVFCASNGTEGLEKFKKNHKKIDLIISDINMPKMSGIDMIKEIRKTDKDVGVIFSTAYSDKEFLIDSIKLKVVNYIVKPIDIRALLESISEFTEHLSAKKIIKTKNKELSLYKEAIDVNTIVIKTDVQMNITYVNSHFCEISGFSKTELIGKEFSSLKYHDVDIKVYNNMFAKVLDNKMWKGKLKQITKDNNILILDSSIIPSHDEDGNINGSMIIQRDITQDVKKQREVEVALMKEKSDIFIKTKETFAKNSVQINELENQVKQLFEELNKVELDKDKYLKLLDKYKDDIKILTSKVNKYEKNEISNIKGIDILKIQKDNANLKIEIKRLRDNMENLIINSQKKVNQLRNASKLEVEHLEKELEKVKSTSGSTDTKILLEKLKYWEEKAKEERGKIEDLEKRVMNFADSKTLSKIFSGK
ncbi:putative PAS/PAC sensor protein [Arcobacter nitrofigilis DSM 7299]|uniref:Putative PAS/PAC sensor protein n=1 Tax=Arcobacter nitrofigilis (strain ATCC 33309 / DSM 7299 / CCUG 15893 / LMG 7604 / NCTC 12251 / CI) TaxID=572480 RepID=D5V2C3_ARCNC|nr:response regulator [Arcobacter nitrofigilis]ADG92356.1 putative PAS/PAC sensor protein [Arcobacter nitrofigilis DSM 7299]